MQEELLTQKRDLAGASFKDWLSHMDELGEERGYFEPLGKRHSAILTDEGPTLIVTFETVEGIRQGSDSHEPIGWDIVAEKGWSNLSIIAHDDTWFRDKAVYGYFDRLVDDGFFEDFDRVVFYGTGMCGYAAAAFSVVAPGATVVAVQPQATLAPEKAEWDTRFPDMRRTNFSDRYGYAPDMTEAADQVFVLYDPLVTVDAMHAALFDNSNVAKLRCRHLGAHIEAELWTMGVLPDVIDKAAKGSLTQKSFFQAYRARRDHLPYLRVLLTRMEKTRRHRMVEMLCNSVVARMKAPRFRQARDQARQHIEKSRPSAEQLPQD